MVVYGIVKVITKFELDEKSAKKVQDFSVANEMDICSAIEFLHCEGEINLFNGNEEPDAEWSVTVIEVEGDK